MSAELFFPSESERPLISKRFYVLRLCLRSSGNFFNHGDDSRSKCFLFCSHPWETVAQAAWRKYPNPMNTAVIGTDVVERTVVDGVLHTHRLVSSRWYFPTWAQRVSFAARNICASKFNLERWRWPCRHSRTLRLHDWHLLIPLASLFPAQR